MGNPIQNYYVRSSAGSYETVAATNVILDGPTVTFYRNQTEEYPDGKDMVAYFPHVDYVIQVEEEDDAELGNKS